MANTSSTLLAGHVRHAVGAAISLAVELIVLVMGHMATGTGHGMWGVYHRLRRKVRRGRDMLRSAREGSKHVRRRNRARLLMMGRDRTRCMGDIRHELWLGGVRSVVHQVRRTKIVGMN